MGVCVRADGTSRTFRCAWMLNELDVSFEWKKVNYQKGETRTPEFLAVNPRGKIPALQDGDDFAIAESAAINTYLGDKFAMFVPSSGTKERGTYDMWCFFLVSELDAASLTIYGRHDYYAAINGEAPAALEAAKKYLQKQVAVVVDELRTKEYILGAFTAVDILLTTILRWAKRIEWLPDDEDSKSVLDAYLERNYARPAFIKTLAVTDTAPKQPPPKKPKTADSDDA